MNENNEDLDKLISKAVDKGIRKSVRKHRIAEILLIILACAAVVILIHVNLSVDHLSDGKMEPVESHDTTLENNGWLGYKAADFQDAVLGESSRKQQLIVDEQEVSLPSSITQTGLWNLGIFSKEQFLTIYGTGEYTVDLAEVKASDIQVDENSFTVTITVPYPQLHSAVYDPKKTVIGDVSRGWLAFGSISLTPEQNKTFETDANAQLEERLSESDCMERAANYAKLSCRSLYQPVVSRLTPLYKVEIEVADAPAAASSAS